MTDLPVQPAIAFGPRVRKSPYFAATRRYGCKAYTVYNHTYMPLYYESPEADFWRLVKDVSLWDVACQRQVEITGADAARFAQLLTPRNLSGCAVGQCKYVLITAEDGGIVNDPVLLRLAEDRFWLSLSDSDGLLWAKGIARHAGLEVSLCEPDVSPLQVQGPKSAAVLRDLFGGWIDGLRYYWCRETELEGIPLVVSRTGWSSERGYEIYLRDGAQGERLWEMIMTAGRPHGIVPGAPSTIRRIEGALLSYGADMTLAENPFELGLGRLVDLEMEADYVGKAALHRIAAEGPARRLVGLELDGPPLVAGNEEPWPLHAAGAPVGRLTSCIYSPRLGKNIALAIVARAQAERGNVLQVEAPNDPREATVVPTPFFDPKKALATA